MQQEETKTPEVLSPISQNMIAGMTSGHHHIANVMQSALQFVFLMIVFQGTESLELRIILVGVMLVVVIL